MRNIKDDQIATLINRLYFSGRNVIKKNNIELIESNALKSQLLFSCQIQTCMQEFLNLPSKFGHPHIH